MPGKRPRQGSLTTEYVVSISGDDNLSDDDINDFIRELEEWLTDQNTCAADVPEQQLSEQKTSSGVQSAG
jgi:hypothetical protein